MQTIKKLTRLLTFAILITIFVGVLTSDSSKLAWAVETPVAADSNGGDEAKQVDQPTSPGLIANLTTLGFLVLLQAVLGFDNLLYISLESKNAPPEKQQFVRVWGIGIAIGLRIGLLCFLIYMKDWFEKTSVWDFESNFATGHINVHSLITLVGGVFIIYTAIKEIWHMTLLEHVDHQDASKPKKSLGAVIFWIVLMNIVFSFDSILSAMALTDVFWVMAIAIIVSGVGMIWLSDHVSTFLAKNRMYEVLGLFILFIVGIMLISEGGHQAHLSFFGNAVQPMTKTTFYFVLGVLVLTDIVQTQYQKKLLAMSGNAKH